MRRYEASFVLFDFVNLCERASGLALQSFHASILFSVQYHNPVKTMLLAEGWLIRKNARGGVQGHFL